ncbi:hypothetical protein DMC47_03075 [Nostoc sp. 3335mG]|nr:hypothetical protein DMC47_03075 [Nostoc sp. 3335mG]
MNVFSVQRVASDDSETLAPCVTVEARSPVQAGEAVLAERLALHGEIVRAKCWFLKEDFTPQSVQLYAANAVSR